MAGRRTQKKTKKKGCLLPILASVLVLFAVLFLIYHFTRPQSEDGGGSQVTSPSDAVTTTAEAPTTTTATTIGTVDNIPVSSAITASGVVLFDSTHNTVLYSVNADSRCYPASLTKLMTAAVASRYCSSDTVFTVGSEISLVQFGSSLAHLEQGQQLNFSAMLDALLLPSGNDAAYVIAARVGRLASGDESLDDTAAVSYFCNLMNDTAQEIGAVNTHFANPDGFHDDNHYTTAMDMALISRYALTFPNIRLTVSKPAASDLLVSGEAAPAWQNSNSLIKVSSSFYYPYANGLKTGFTDEAGYCLAASAQKDGVELIAITMNSPEPNDRWTNSIALFDAGFSYLTEK